MKHFLKNAALLGASVCLAVLVAEGGLRLAGFSYPLFYREDLYRGDSLRPGAEGWFRGEGGSYVRINSDGLRDREHTLAKPPNTLRIAVLGDSFAEAMVVPAEKAFWSVLERRLSACPALGGKKVEAINFGVSGYGTAQELLTLQHFVWKYNPDIVLLAFFTGNDVRNNSAALNQDPRAPYFVYRGGRLTLDDSYRRLLREATLGPVPLRFWEWMDEARSRSRVLQLVTEARLAIRQRLEVRAQAAGKEETVHRADGFAVEQQAALGGELGVDNAVYAPPRDQAWEDAWKVTEGLLVAMRDEVRAHGARFFVATLSTGIQVYPDVKVRANFMRRLGVENLFYPDERVAALGRREGIPVITLAPRFADYAAKEQVFLHGFPNAIPGFGHWNVEGHRLGGELIADRLCEALR